MTGIYEYTALPEGYFRLLTITSIENDEITCTLENFLLDEAPEYTAFSYVWGNPLASKEIICDGKLLAITPHLHETIIHLHALDPMINVWIDAICINQIDKVETAHHTRKMNIVYGSAQKVLAWLGKGDENSDNAMDRIEDINEKLSLILEDGTPENIAFIENWLGKDTLTSTNLPSTNDPTWAALGRIFSQRWFTRLWILQEVVLAQHLLIAHGNRQINWTSITKLSTSLRRANLIGLLGGKNPTIISEIKKSFLAIDTFRIAKIMVEKNHPSLLQFVAIARDKNVTHPADRIYGLLGLINPNIASQIEVDYSAAWWDVYIQYGKFQLRSEPSLLLLSMAASKDRPRELPSWCPNFNSSPMDMFSFGGVVGFKAGFEDWGHRVKGHLRIPDSNDKNNTIEISGFRLGIVSTVIGSPKLAFETDSPSESAAMLLDYESRCLELSQDIYNITDTSSSTSENKNEIPEAHWRTLTADADLFSRCPLADDVFEDYLGLKKVLMSRVVRDQTRTSTSTSTSPHPSTSPNPESEPDLDVDSPPTSKRQAHLNYYQSWESKRTHTFFSIQNNTTTSTSTSHSIGLGPANLQPGDVICALYGGAPLFVLRFNEDQGNGSGSRRRGSNNGKSGSNIAKLIGDAFVYGGMDLKPRGEDLEGGGIGRGEDEWFVIG